MSNLTTVLVVEDEPELLRRVKEILADAGGYEVLCATSYAEGREKGIDHPLPIALLLSNVILDGGQLGSDLAAELKAARPKMRVILIDGKACGELNILQRARQGWELVENPFEGDSLIVRIRAELGGTG